MKDSVNILLASPRGFCAGVKRAIEMVELAIKKHGAPIYVRHEIVHNKRVVEDLTKKGAIFVEELKEVPEGSKVIFSAHGVAKQIKEQGGRGRELQERYNEEKLSNKVVGNGGGDAAMESSRGR